MKELPESNYAIEIRSLEHEVDPDVWAQLSAGYLLTLNHAVSVAVIPYAPADLRPPRYRAQLDIVASRDDAAWSVLSTSSLVVTASPDGRDRIEELVYDGPPDRCSVFLLPASQYRDLVDDIEKLMATRRDRWQRLDEIGQGPLSELLRVRLPDAAALTNDERRLLCLRRVNGVA